MFGAAQDELQRRSTRLVAAAVDDPVAMLSLPVRLRIEADRVARDAASRVPALAGLVTDGAAGAGARAVPAWVTVPAHQPNSVAMIAQELAGSLRAAALRITRFANDAYRAAVLEAAARQAAGALTPRVAQQHAWRDLMGRGVTGFTDTAGRDWNLATYTEMAVRTAAARAYRDSQHDRMLRAGIQWFTVSDTARPCQLCAPWQGRVLAATGAGTFTDDGVVFDVAATVAEATAAGLFHPNCKHTLVAYTPGVTLLREARWTARDEAEYQATQRLRALERAVRGAKAQQGNALTPADWAAAGRRVRDLNAQIRAHVAEHGLNRRRERERPNLGFKETP